MERSAIVRRDAATARRERALERFPARSGAEFVAELTHVIAELRSVASEVDEASCDPVEYAATLGLIGKAYFDLAADERPQLLAESVRHYLEAEQILAKVDAPIAEAKLAHDLAEALRGQAAGRDRALLEAAQYRYRRALDVFKRHGASSLIERTESALLAVRKELRAARVTNAKQTFSPSSAEVVKLRDLLACHGGWVRSLELAVDAARVAPDAGCDGLPLPAGSRAARLHELLRFVKQYLFAESSRPSHGAEARAHEAFRQLAELDTAIHRAGEGDPGVAELEPRAWALARAARRLARRAHVTIARPRWPSRAVRQDARAVFVSGCAPERLPERQLAERGIHLLLEPKHGADPSHRYGQLKSADLGWFHLSRAPDEGDRDRDRARLCLANTCYELGVGLALGQAILLVADAGAEAPFEIPGEVSRLSADKVTDPVAIEALEELAFSVPWAAEGLGARAGLEQTLAFARSHFTENLQGEARVAWAMAADSVGRPEEFADRLRRFLAYCDGGTELLFPAWPASYPRPGVARCFHATPFRKWSERTRNVVRAACAQRGVEYSCGEETGGLSLPRAIWHEVGAASYVLADVTNLTPGVALALGMAHALGKPCSLVFGPEHDADADRPARLFPGIAADRISSYTSRDDHATLARAIDESGDSRWQRAARQPASARVPSAR